MFFGALRFELLLVLCVGYCLCWQPFYRCEIVLQYYMFPSDQLSSGPSIVSDAFSLDGNGTSYRYGAERGWRIGSNAWYLQGRFSEG